MAEPALRPIRHEAQGLIRKAKMDLPWNHEAVGPLNEAHELLRGIQGFTQEQQVERLREVTKVLLGAVEATEGAAAAQQAAFDAQQVVANAVPIAKQRDFNQRQVEKGKVPSDAISDF